MSDDSESDHCNEIPDPDLELEDEDDDSPWSELIEGSWEFSDRMELCPDGADVNLYTPPSQKNHYIQYLKNSRDLLLHNPTTVLNAWRKDGPMGLFLLFITMLKSMLVWTNQAMEAKGLPPVKMSEFRAFIGLEMGASLIGFNSIKDFWSTKDFKGSNVYRDTMPRTRYEQIRANFKIHPPSDNSTDQFEDPLSFCRLLLSNFQKRCFKLATPRGACAGDEASQGCAGKTRGTTFNKDKPDKHAFRFYCFNSHTPNYVNAIFDNNAGKCTSLFEVVILTPFCRQATCRITLPLIDICLFFQNFAKCSTSTMVYGKPSLWNWMIHTFHEGVHRRCGPHKSYNRLCVIQKEFVRTLLIPITHDISWPRLYTNCLVAKQL